jgi:hypothetical protein
MSRRAASMAEMAKRASNPQDIQAIQQRLVAGVQNGTIKSYIGIPLIQELTNKLTAVKAKMAQTVAGAGMQQPAQGGAPIAQQVMAQAAQADQPQGVEALPSNLPQSYAGGGIIAFEDGGQVERYQNTGYTGSPSTTGEIERKRVEDAIAKLRTYGLRQRQLDPQGFAAAEQESKQAQDALSKLERSITGGPAGVMGKSMGLAMPPLAPVDTTKPMVDPYDPATATRRSMFEGQGQVNTGPAAPASSAAPATPSVAMPSIKLPDAPKLTDYSQYTKDLATNMEAASDTKRKAKLAELEGFDKPMFESREGRLGKREAAQDKDSAIARALTGIKAGLRIAGSKERTLAGALGNEGAQGIEDLMRGEIANRAAKERLADMRDNLDQQKAQAKKGNYQAAEAAGNRASDDLRQATQMTMTGAHYGNTESNQRLQIQQQGILGLGQIQATNASTNAQLQLGTQRMNLLRDQIAAGDKRAAAALAGAQQKAYTAFRQDRGTMELERSLKDRFGPNFMQNPQAQAQIQQAAQTYMMNAVPSLLGADAAGSDGLRRAARLRLQHRHDGLPGPPAGAAHPVPAAGALAVVLGHLAGGTAAMAAGL